MMRMTVQGAFITVAALMGSVLLGGCATPHRAAVMAQPVTCAVHYRDLTQRWVAADYRCAEPTQALAPPRVRTLQATVVDPQRLQAGGWHGAR